MITFGPTGFPGSRWVLKNGERLGLIVARNGTCVGQGLYQSKGYRSKGPLEFCLRIMGAI